MPSGCARRSGAATIFARDAAAARRLGDLLARPAPDAPVRLGPLTADHPDGLFLDGVARVLEYLRAGDAYQVNLSRRLSATLRDGRGAADRAGGGAAGARPRASRGVHCGRGR